MEGKVVQVAWEQRAARAARTPPARLSAAAVAEVEMEAWGAQVAPAEVAAVVPPSASGVAPHPR